MKTLRRLQKAAIIAGLMTAMAIADGENATRKEYLAALILVGLIIITICYQQMNEERRNEK